MLERVLGRGNFLALYFVGGITGNAVSYAADVLAGGMPAVSAGASTSVFALFVAVALLGVLHKGNRHVFAQYSKSMLAIIGVNVAYTFLVPGISVSGHLGGALGGLIAMFMVPSKNLCVPNAVRIVVAVLWTAALAWAVVGALGYGSGLGSRGVEIRSSTPSYPCVLGGFQEVCARTARALCHALCAGSPRRGPAAPA